MVEPQKMLCITPHRVKFRSTALATVTALLKHLSSREPTAPKPLVSSHSIKNKGESNHKTSFQTPGQILGSAHNDPPSPPVTSVTREAEEHLAPVLCCLGSACAFDLGQVASSFACQFPLWIIITILALREGIPEFTRL